MFFKATSESYSILNVILKEFGLTLGILINQWKSKLFFSTNALRIIKKFLSSTFGIKVVSWMLKYLETFPDFDLHCKENFQDIIAKLNRKLQGWKDNLLS